MDADGDGVKTCEYDGTAFAQARSHPWTRAEASAEFRYYDLKKEPEHIRVSLEDLRPWERYAAIEQFYRLIEAINAPGTPIESNDCAFSGVTASATGDPAKKFECTGRVMVLHSALAENLSEPNVTWLKNAMHYLLRPLDPSFDGGIIGTTVIPVRYLELPGNSEAQLGHQLMVSFWAWGSSEADVMASLERLLTSLTTAFVQLSEAILTREN